MEIRSDRRYWVDRARVCVWDTFTRVESYRQWWPWLREFDGAAFEAGERWRCVVKPPLPYTLRFDVSLTEVVEYQRVRATVDGDIVGWAELSARDHDGGCDVRLVSRLAAANRVPRMLARLARPVAAFGHDWVLDTGARQFIATAFPDP